MAVVDSHLVKPVVNSSQVRVGDEALVGKGKAQLGTSRLDPYAIQPVQKKRSQGFIRGLWKNFKSLRTERIGQFKPKYLRKMGVILGASALLGGQKYDYLPTSTELFREAYTEITELFREAYTEIIVDHRDDSGNTRLMKAAFYGNIDSVNTLLTSGADIDEKNDEGDTALRMAVVGKYYDIAKLLVAQGANLNIQNSKGYTALSQAVYDDNMEMVTFLIENGADLTLTDNEGHKVSYWANSEEMKALLTQYGLQ